MNNIFKALNVKNQEEMDNLIESFDLNDKQYITFMSALNEDMSPDGIRFMLENITKEFYNGSYEKLVEQYKKPVQERVLKEMPMTKDQYDKLKVGDRVKYDKETLAPNADSDDLIIDKNDKEIKTQFHHHGGQARTVNKWSPEHFREVHSLKEYTEIIEPKHKVGDRIVTMGKVSGWDYAGSKIVGIIEPQWQAGDEAHYSYIIRGIVMDKDIGKPVLSKDSTTVPVETIDTLNEDTVFDHSWYEVKGRKYPKRTKEGVIIKEDVAKINPKVLDELYEIISDQMGNMYLANYDEVDFDNLLDSVDDFGNDIDGYNPALKKDYALALKAKWEKDNKDFENDYILDLSAGIFEGAAITEAKDVLDEPDRLEEPVEEEKPASTKDPKLQAEIEQMNQIVDTTNNEEVLGNLLQQVDAKLPLAQDTEQMNSLAELKQKIETKLSTGVSINEAYEYNPDDEDIFEQGDQVSFVWGDETIIGKVKRIKKIGSNRYYTVRVFNTEDKKEHNYIDVDPIGNEMKRIYDIDPEDLNETSCCGGTCAGAIAQVKAPSGSVKKRKKKKLADEIENHLFKEYVLNNVPCEVELNGHKMKFFENEGKWYMSVDNALVKTFDKNVMMETADQINYEEPITADLLEGYSCYEMNILMEDGDNNFENNAKDEELVNILSATEKTLDPNQTEEIKKQNIESAKEMNLKNKGQDVQLVDPKTSMEKDVKFIDGDENDGIGYIQDKQGKVSEVPMNLLKSKG